MAYTFYKIAAFSVGWHQGQIGIELVSQNVAGNYSVLNLIFQVKETTNASSYNNGGANMYLALDGVARASSNTIDFRTYSTGTWYTNLTASNVVVYHGSDGNKTISLQGYCATGVGAGTYNPGAQSIALPQIARKSTAVVTSTVEVNATNEVTATITRADASFTHTVTFSIGSYSQSYTGVATSQAFAIPMAWLNAIPNSVSGAANCRIETFSGATSLGYNDYGFTITVASTIIPVVTDITFARDTTGTDPFNVFTKGVSKVSLTEIVGTWPYSATGVSGKTYMHLASESYLNGSVYDWAFISNVIPYSGTMRLTTILTDSRGRSSTPYYEDFTVYDYFAPSLTVNAFRCGSTGIADPDGEYLSATMTVNVAPVNNDNTKAYVLEFKKTTDLTWTAIDTSALTGYSGTLNAVRSADSSYTWEVRASITDKVNVATKSTEVGTKRVAINVGSSGTAVAVGKIAETADLFEVDLPTQFNKAVEFTGEVTGITAPPSAVKYTLATAGSNGDFHITTGAALATNDIVYITFPSATNGASNARLSVDGGTTYKNIFISGVQAIAKSVMSTSVALKYDGTQFIAESLLLYSTTEFKTNERWLDGKPIYRKTYVINMTTAVTATINVTSLSIGHIVMDSLNSFFTYNGTDWVQIGHYGGAYDWSRWYSNATTFSLVLGSGYNTANKVATITIRYTKTTD